MERTGRECGLGRTQDWGFSILQPVEWAAELRSREVAVGMDRRRQALATQASLWLWKIR